MKFLYRFFREIGVDFKKVRNVRFIPRYIKQIHDFKKNEQIDSLFPCLSDWNEQSGGASGHYFHQDLLVAQKIFKNNPNYHLDIGSRVDGFIAHVASFRKIDVMDIRLQKNHSENINFIKGDLTRINKKKFNSYDSVSCLHTIKHIGLGRYGDNIIPNGYKIAIENLKNIVKKNGILYLSTPIGKNERIEFNAHRVFNINTILKLFNDWELLSFSYVDDFGNLHKNINLNKLDLSNNYNLNWGCGIFEFKK